MSPQWELEYEVSWRPRQVVYIRIKADILALTYPNKRQAVCYPASTGGGAAAAGGGDRGGRMSEKRQMGGYEGLKQTGTRRSVATMQSSSHLSFSPRREKHQLAYKAKHDMRLAAISEQWIQISSPIWSFSHISASPRWFRAQEAHSSTLLNCGH